MANSNLIISWNCNGVYQHLEDLYLLLSLYNPSVLCLQESHLKNNQLLNISSYKIIKSVPPDNYWTCGGVASAVHNNLSFCEISLNTSLQAVAATVYFKSPLTICSIYLPPNVDVSHEEFQALISALPKPFIICGDFNAHSPYWGSNKTNTRGQIIESCVYNSNLVVTHPSEPTHYNFSHKVWSTLDLVIHSPRLSSSLQIYNHIDMAGSDHFPTILRLYEEEADCTINSPFRRNYSKTDWDSYRESLDQVDFNSTENLDISSTVQNFTQTLISCAESHSPPIPTCTNKRRVPWCTEECAVAIKEC